MRLRLKRLDERRYETVITRLDGVTYHVKGVGHMATMPHDLAHFVIEKALGIRQGFWGSVADGAVFGSLTHVSGRRRSRAAERSNGLLKANKDILTATENLVGLFNQAFEEGLGPESPELRERLGRYLWIPPGHQPRQFTNAEIVAVCSGWKEMLNLWQELPIGGTLELVWPDPDPVHRKRSR